MSVLLWNEFGNSVPFGSTEFLETGKIKELPPYEDVIRPFNVNKDVEFTDVWDFYSVRPYKGKHPAEKPLDMLEHCIQSSSYEEDIVLDCFAGSGSTAVSALLNNRKTISVELDKDWALAIKKRLEKLKEDELTQKLSNELIMKRTKAFIKTETKEKVMTLFNK